MSVNWRSGAYRDLVRVSKELGSFKYKETSDRLKDIVRGTRDVTVVSVAGEVPNGPTGYIASFFHGLFPAVNALTGERIHGDYTHVAFFQSDVPFVIVMAPVRADNGKNKNQKELERKVREAITALNGIETPNINKTIKQALRESGLHV